MSMDIRPTLRALCNSVKSCTLIPNPLARVSLFLSVFLAIPFQGISMAQTKGASRTMYEVWVKAPDITYSVSINGVGLPVQRFQSAPDWSQSVNQWICAGENVVLVKLSTDANQKMALKSGDDVRLEFREIASEGENQKTKVLASADWTYVVGKAWPQTLEIRAVLKPTFDARWEWLQADRIEKADLQDASLRRMVERLNSALSGKNMAKLKAMLEVKTREMARAYQVPLDKRLRDQEEFFQEFFDDPKWKMQQVSWNGIHSELHAQGRLLELRTQDGKPFLASGDLAGGGNFRLALFLYRTRGEWRLAR